MPDARYIELNKAIVKDFGHEIRKDFTILDFGCGDGDLVQQWRAEGYEAFGADIKLDKRGDFIRLITCHNGVYRIPFESETFDFVYSNQVLEHVSDLAVAVSEIHRVLKPGGCSLHIFPPRFRLIEPHFFVPLGGMFQSYSWLLFWALIGVRNHFQKDRPFAEVARSNHEYLRGHTCYRPKKEIRQLVLAEFNNVAFAERYLIKHSYGRARYIYPLVRIFPFIASWYGLLHAHALFFGKQD